MIHQPSAGGATSLEEHSVSQDFITLTAERELHPLVTPKASQFLDQLRLSPAQGCVFPSLLILVTLQKTRPTGWCNQSYPLLMRTRHAILPKSHTSSHFPQSWNTTCLSLTGPQFHRKQVFCLKEPQYNELPYTPWYLISNGIQWWHVGKIDWKADGILL